jgi:flavin reductase (DIM6/NTAB) family NADH-FMN oxidoreductase RutF
MAVAIRGSATARFYKTFHAWSRLGSVTHQQRRGFIPTSSIREANDAQSTQSSPNIRQVRTSPNRNSRDGLDTTHNTQHGRNTKHQAPRILKTTTVEIPEDRFARMQKHPTYLHRMQTTLNIKLEPSETPTNDGQRMIHITAKGNAAHEYARTLLLRDDDDDQSLTHTVFQRVGDRKKNASAVLTASLSSEGISLLRDNNDELRLRIQQAFSVELDVKQDDGAAVDAMHTVFITGDRSKVGPAKDFIQTLHLDLDQPLQHREHRVEAPLAKSPMPASTPSKPAQTASQTSPQTSPRSKPRSSPQSNPQSTPQASPQPSSQSSDPISSQTSPAILKHEYKATMRSVPSSVAVLITSLPSTQSTRSNIDSLRGMTVSSLSSITLEPEPVVSFSIRGPSRTLDCITAGQPFTVNFLNAHARGASLADLFSRPHDDPSQPFRTIQGSDLARVYESSHPNGPAIGGGQIPARFTCELLPGKSLEIGDHTVVFARVVSIWRAPDMRGPKARTFLGYAQAAYRQLHGNEISPTDLAALEKSVAAKASERDELSRRRRIRIGNLPLTAKAEDVKEYLNKSGLVFKNVHLSILDGQNPSYCFARFRSEVEAEGAIRTLDGASFMGRSLKVSLATSLRSRQEEKAPGSQVFDEPASTEPASTEPVSTESTSTESISTESTSIEQASTGPADSDLIDAYWRMALDEDNEADVLEERAADQRALGEAEKPIDHPAAANAEGDKQEK